MFGFTDQYVREPILVAKDGIITKPVTPIRLPVLRPVLKDVSVVPYGQDTPNIDPDAQPPSGPLDVATTNTEAANARNVAELERRIKAAGGALTVGPNSSSYIVAVNNRLRFSVTQVGPDRFEIRESNTFTLLIAAAVIAGALVVFNRGR